MEDKKTYVASSRIEGAGNGLFASEYIYRGEVIAIFKKVVNSKYRISYDKDKIYHYTTCNAHFSNDIVDISSLNNFYQNLITGEPIINKHDGLVVNAEIKFINSDEIALVALDNILTDNEIYTHYGLSYWIHDENILSSYKLMYNEMEFVESILFRQDSKTIIKFPECIDYLPTTKKSIENYIKLFYGDDSIIENKYKKEADLPSMYFCDKFYLALNDKMKKISYINKNNFLDALYKKNVPLIIKIIVDNILFEVGKDDVEYWKFFPEFRFLEICGISLEDCIRPLINDNDKMTKYHAAFFSKKIIFENKFQKKGLYSEFLSVFLKKTEIKHLINIIVYFSGYGNFFRNKYFHVFEKHLTDYSRIDPNFSTLIISEINKSRIDHNLSELIISILVNHHKQPSGV